MPDDFNPNLIPDPTLREVVLYLMNQVEELATKVKLLSDQIQRLKDENKRLKGEQAKPKIKPTSEPKLISSEKNVKPKALAAKLQNYKKCHQPRGNR